MNLFEKESHKIVKNPDVLNPNYSPDKLPHRENEIDSVISCIKPIITRSIAENVFIHGTPGIGKTAATQHILDELEDYTEKVIPLFINCWQYYTRHAILVYILNELGELIPRKGISTDELWERLVSKMELKAEGYVIALDEVDRIGSKESAILYDLVRLDIPIALIMISNNPYAFNNLDHRIKSSLLYDEIEFKQYSFDELKDIYLDRLKNAFYPGTYAPELASLVARFVENAGSDVRLGLDALNKASRLAEKENASKVTGSHIKSILKEIRSRRLKMAIKDLKKEEKEIMSSILACASPVTTGKVFDLYKSSGGKIADRTFRKYLSHLEEIRLIQTQISAEGFRGKTKIISLKYPHNEIEEMLS